MHRIPVHRNNEAFRIEQMRSGEGKVPLMTPGTVAKLRGMVFILIGDRTPAFGGGLASNGYVMHAGKAVGTIAVKPSDVERGMLQVS